MLTSHLLSRRELLAELVEDELVAVEMACLEDEFRVLSEENATLLNVHTERAQQLETLSSTNRNQTSQDSSSTWPPELDSTPRDDDLARDLHKLTLRARIPKLLI